MQEINLQELAIEFLTKLDARFTPEEQAQLLQFINLSIDNFGEGIKHFLDPVKREEILKQGRDLFNEHKGQIEKIGFQIEETIS